MQIRPLEPNIDHDEWLRMRELLWPMNTLEIHQLEMKHQLDATRAGVFVLDRGDGRLGGFAEVRIREFAEGCHSGRVPYLEGWFVDEDLRGQGWGGKLINEIEQWSRKMNCTELASDTWTHNEESHLAHLKLGFTEHNRLIHYRKDL
jgi:aminoglycoside 6'-N-acetyltransferase I